LKGRSFYLAYKRSIFTRGTPGNTVEHADYQCYLVFYFYNVLIVNILIMGLQMEFTVHPDCLLNYWHSIYYKIKGIYNCKPPFKFTEQLCTAGHEPTSFVGPDTRQNGHRLRRFRTTHKRSLFSRTEHPRTPLNMLIINTSSPHPWRGCDGFFFVAGVGSPPCNGVKAWRRGNTPIKRGTALPDDFFNLPNTSGDNTNKG